MTQTTVDELYDQLYDNTRGVNETIKVHMLTLSLLAQYSILA